MQGRWFCQERAVPRLQGLREGRGRIGRKFRIGDSVQKKTGKPKAKCKNCEGKGLLKNGDKKVRCQRCGGTGFKP
jgi:hypothetical protein